VVVEQNSTQNVDAGSTTLEDVSILGTTQIFHLFGYYHCNGRYFNQAEVDRKQKVAVLGATLAESYLAIQRQLARLYQLANTNTKVTVVGVFNKKGQVGDADYDSRLYVPITVVFQKFTPSQFARIMGDRVRMIYVKVDDSMPLDDVILQNPIAACQTP